MFKLSEIKDLIKLIDQTSVNELEIENEGSRLCIRKHKSEIIQMNSMPASSATASATSHVSPNHFVQDLPVEDSLRTDAQQASQNLHRIVSPMVGTFYASPSPGADSFVRSGDRVKEKTVVCIVEAMKLMNEIIAEVNGEIVEVLVENGQLVEFGQPLFLVKTE